MWRRVRFVWFGLWFAAAALLVAAAVFTVRSRQADERSLRAEAERLDHAANRADAEALLGRDEESLASVLARFDSARSTYWSKAGERDEARGRMNGRLAEVDALRNGVTSEGLKILDQGTHLQELVLCLKAGERTLNALANGDTATAMASLQSADAECRSSSAFLLERAQSTTTALLAPSDASPEASIP